MQTDLPCSVLLRGRVLRSLPRGNPRRSFRIVSSRMLLSPWRERLGFPIVNLSRLQASLHVAARVLASRCSRALDVALRPPGSLLAPATCYPALRRLPGRDSHPLEKRSKARRSPEGCRLRRHGAPSLERNRSGRPGAAIRSAPGIVDRRCDLVVYPSCAMSPRSRPCSPAPHRPHRTRRWPP